MRTQSRYIFILSIVAVLLMGQEEQANASYQVTLQPAFSWLGTTASRTAAASTTYKYTYGDEASVVFGLPWLFSFYGQTYNQITVDTNGNIWFGDKGTLYSYHSFPPATTNGNPVITMWNDDLSSYFYGGVFVQRLTNPDCVVVEWNTETYSDEGYCLPNRIEAVLFPDGKIRLDYKEFNATRQNYPQGSVLGSTFVSNGVGSYVVLTGSSAQSQAGKSYIVKGIPKNVSVAISGTGSGTVVSTPVGMACNSNCTQSFPYSTALKLQATPDQYSLFESWLGAGCGANVLCSFSLITDMALTATFSRDTTHQVMTDGTSQPFNSSSIQAAYDASTAGDTINLWAVSYQEDVSCSRDVDITIRGGFNAGYTSVSGETILNGSLNITAGSVTLDELTIK